MAKIYCANKIWLGDKLVQENKALVSVLDRGFLYGDGVYETVRAYDGRIFRLANHLKRLNNSLKGISLKIPWPQKRLAQIFETVLKANGIKDCLIRMTISRGVGKIGYDPSTCGIPTLVVLSTPIRSDLNTIWEKGVKICIPEVRRNHIKSLSPAIKHTNCLNGILAKIESLKIQAFEGVLLNLEGFITEGTISNIFIIKKGAVKTPSLDCGILDGVTRASMIEVAKKSGLKVIETKIKPSEIYDADEVFLTSTTMEAMPVVNVNGKVIAGGNPGPITRLVHKGFRALLKKELGIILKPLPFL